MLHVTTKKAPKSYLGVPGMARAEDKTPEHSKIENLALASITPKLPTPIFFAETPSPAL